MISQMLQQAREFEIASGPRIPEELRQVFHFTPFTGWLNDPNGFSVYRGEYHLFYQYHPYSSLWGPMHWGHAKTRDFLAWEYLPAAMAPDSGYDFDGCWSGSAEELDDGRQLLLYTGRRIQEGEIARQVQCLAVGDGLDYEKYSGNPVLTAADLPDGCSPYDFRDPKMWRTADGTFRAVTVSKTADGSGAVLLYRSSDGFAWKFERVLDSCRNEIGKMWECPDFFPLDGKQALIVSPMEMEAREPEFHAGFGCVVMLGRYNGAADGQDGGTADGPNGGTVNGQNVGTADEPNGGTVNGQNVGTADEPDGGAFIREAVQTLDHGPDFYAAQTLLTPDGRRVMIAWMQNWASAKTQPDERLCWAGMTVPRELSLRDGRLVQVPVRELEAWRRNPVSHKAVPVTAETALDGIRGRILDLVLSVRPDGEKPFRRFRVSVAADGAGHTAVEYIPERNIVRIERDLAGAPTGAADVREFAVRSRGGALDLRLLLDRHSLELFANGGEQASSVLLYAPQSAERITFSAEGGAAILDADCWTLEKP